VVNCKNVKVHGELVVEIGKGVGNNGIGFRVEFEEKNSKVQSSEIKMVVRVNKMACP
jgi:hypothetical protein